MKSRATWDAILYIATLTVFLAALYALREDRADGWTATAVVGWIFLVATHIELRQVQKANAPTPAVGEGEEK